MNQRQQQRASLWEGVTIDPVGARDLDDAIWCASIGSGWRLEVAVPDVAGRVQPGSPTDLQALARGATAYSNLGIRQPMLPWGLQDELSLTAEAVKDCILFRCGVAFDGSVSEARIERMTFRSIGRHAYDDVPELLRSEDAKGEMLRAALAMAQHRRKARVRHAATMLYDPDEKGRWATFDPDNVGCLIVSEAMIAINHSVARNLARRKRGIFRVYRPSEEPMPSLLDPFDVDVAEGQLRNLASEYAELCTRRAYYSYMPLPHVALGLDVYCHATSPLRRYADLENQRDALGEPIRRRTSELPEHLTRQMWTIAKLRDTTSETQRAPASPHHPLDAQQLHNADVKSYVKFAKRVLGEAGVDDVFEDDLARRIGENAIPVQVLAFALFGAATTPRCRDAALDAIVAAPNLAASMWNMAGTLFGLPTPAVSKGREGELFVCRASIQRDTDQIDGRARALSGALAEHGPASLLLRWFGFDEPTFQDGASPFAMSTAPRTVLVNYTQRHGLPQPAFVTNDSGEWHSDQRFSCIGKMLLANGSEVESSPMFGRAKRDAELAAATALLALVPVSANDIATSSPAAEGQAVKEKGMPIQRIYERAQRLGVTLAYEFASAAQGFACTVRFGNDEAVGIARTKQGAKGKAAALLLAQTGQSE